MLPQSSSCVHKISCEEPCYPERSCAVTESRHPKRSGPTKPCHPERSGIAALWQFREVEGPCVSHSHDLSKIARISTALLLLLILTACGSSAPTATTQKSTPPTNSSNSGSSAKSFSNLQASSGWGQFAQGPPNFVNCSPSPCDGISFGMEQGIQSPSMRGPTAEFNVGGTTLYGDAFFNNHLIGAYSSQGLPDNNGTLVPSLHTFTYDVYFYGDNLGVSQALEFDVNQFLSGMGLIWGHECRIAGGNEWDVWDNQNAHWKPTGISCYPNSAAWNHVTIQVQRTVNNELLYQSITLNGDTHTLNWTFPPGSAPSNWYGVTINYQMDGDSRQDPYNIYLDNLTFSYE